MFLLKTICFSLKLVSFFFTALNFQFKYERPKDKKLMDMQLLICVLQI